MNIQPSYGAPRNKRTIGTAVLAASMITIMLVAQLYGFEDFPVALTSIMPSNDARLLKVAASIIVFGEIFALPYLLGMYVSRLLRLVSALLAFVVGGFWLVTSFTNAHAGNSGLFSTVLTVPGGLIAAAWSTVLFVLICKTLFADSRFRHASS